MKRVLKWAGIVIGVVILIIAGAVGFVQTTWSFDHPDTPLPAIQASTDPGTIARGEYLVHAVAHCSTCHSSRAGLADQEWNLDAPLEGGYVIAAGPFGTFTAANLTPHETTGIGAVSDGQIARVLRHGVNRHGQLSPVMRLAVGRMSDEDMTAVISYLRAQAPIDAQRAGPVFGFMAKALSKRFGPRAADVPAHVPAGDISIERGQYLANGPAFCYGCHTNADPLAGFAPVGAPFSGGMVEVDPKKPDFQIVAPNLTPDPRTGHVTSWSEDQFVARLGGGRVIASSSMPWEAFQRMTENDVRSIYRYLRSLDPVENETGPTYRPKGSFKPSAP